MTKTPCDRCSFYANSPFLVCAVHPYGPQANPCPDFESAELWAPENIEDFLEQQMADLWWHPLFTGRCPECLYNFSRFKLPPLHWQCPICGWEDDTF